MSWIKENYEKAALGGAVLVGVGVGAMVATSSDEVNELVYQPKSSGKNEVEVPQALPALSALGASSQEHTVESKKQDDRDIWLFTGIDLHVNESSPEATQDLRTSAPVHSEIPNLWWLEHGVDIGFADSPQRDHDGDGFSNLEEFNAKTGPAEANDYPEPIVKLKVDSLEVSTWRLKWSEFGAGVLQWTLYRDFGNRAVRPERANAKVGDKIFDGMFEYAGLKEKKGGNGLSKKLATLKDFRAGRNGDLIEVGRRDENKKPGRLVENYKISLALGALGQEANSFEVTLNTPFSLPYKPDAESKPYTLTSVKKQGDAYSLIVSRADTGQETELIWKAQ